MITSTRWLLRAGMRAVYRGGRDASLPVLAFHRALPEHDPMNPEAPDQGQLDRTFSEIASLFRVMPLQEALDALREDRLPPRAAAITFDDGYRDNHDVALPLLKKHGFSATFFVASDFLEGTLMWNDIVVESVRRMPPGDLDLQSHGAGQYRIGDTASRCRAAHTIVQSIKYMPPDQRSAVCERLRAEAGEALPDDVMMRPDHVREVARQGITVGGHTCSHPILTSLDLAQARSEIETNRARLRDIVGTVPTLFAYPNGKPKLDYAADHIELVRQAGYTYAVSTGWAVATPRFDPMQVPRFGIRGETTGSVAFEIGKMIRHRKAPVV